MARKSYNSETGEVSMQNDSQGPVLIVINGMVDAFCEVYEPCDSECAADEIFTIGRLREFFNAYQMIGMVDPLSEYLNMLAEQGYCLHMTSLGVPGLTVSLRG